MQTEEGLPEWGQGLDAKSRTRCSLGRGWGSTSTSTSTPALCPQHSVTLVPVQTFTSEFLEPRVHCVSSHGTFGPSR